MAMLVVIGGEAVGAGEEAIVQLRFGGPVVAAHGQRFIIRNETAQATLGGGRVIRPVSRRLRARDEAETAALTRAEDADAFVRYEEAVRSAGFETASSISMACQIGVEPEEVSRLAERLRAAGRVEQIATTRQVHRDVLLSTQERALAYLKRHHVASPQEPGVLKDRFVGWLERRSAAGLGRVIFSRLEAAGHVVTRGPYVAHREFRPALSTEDAALVEKLVAEITAARFDPPAWASLRTTTGLSKQRAKMLEEIARTEPRLVQYAPSQFISAVAVEELKATVRRLGTDGRFTLAQVRDALSLSRRVVQPMLEYLDRVQFTRRIGDERVLTEKTT
jgi:selenocysteine-specific elongation factor